MSVMPLNSRKLWRSCKTHIIARTIAACDANAASESESSSAGTIGFPVMKNNLLSCWTTSESYGTSYLCYQHSVISLYTSYASCLKSLPAWSSSSKSASEVRDRTSVSEESPEATLRFFGSVSGR